MKLNKPIKQKQIYKISKKKKIELKQRMSLFVLL